MKIPKEKLENLPLIPGCYLFSNNAGEVIYVGKAKQLRKRVGSYFANKNHDTKTGMLVSEIATIDFIATRNEVEALLLENSLIKKHYPKYNIDLKDAQKYSYIHLVTSNTLPFIEVDRGKTSGSGEYYGPFVSGFYRKTVMDVLSRTFKILTRKPSPRMKKLIDPAAYRERVLKARKILRGEVDELIEELNAEREAASKRTFYEYARTLTNQIEALKSMKEKQIVESTRAFDANIFNYSVSADTAYLLVFSIRKGVLEGKQEYVLPYSEGFLDEFLLRYYDNAPIPQEVIVPHKVDEALADYLTKIKRRRVRVIIPEKGDRKELLELVMKNVQNTYFYGKERLAALKEALDLPKTPLVMECFDISHLSGTGTVASMVQFREGIPDKTNYRKYKIRAPIENDDYIAMQEVIQRRYSRVKRGEIKAPDLIIVDGGKGQLSSAVAVLKSLDMKIPIISLAKKLEEIYTPAGKEPIRLPKTNKGLQLLQAIRDEAHRFAITYQKLIRSKGLTE
jgi:excinuclease ABC subunit C